MPSHWSGPLKERRALDAYITLMRATNSVNARLHGPLATAHGLTMGQLGVLEALHHLGPMSQSALAGKLLVSASNLTTVLDNLERDGLVKRVRDTVDRRVSNVHLTPAGRTRITACMPGHVARITAALQGLTATEQKQLAQLCRKLGLAAAGLDREADEDAA
ncbi:MAG: MarR family transcriptional regulator [Gemmatimonadaceae bacterium]|nr:MarR family transcriptional regulator [Gemmatimonadaceae bacterium]